MKVFSRKIQAITLLLATTATLLFVIKTHYEASRSMDVYMGNLRHSHLAPHDILAAEAEPVATTAAAPSVKLHKEAGNDSLLRSESEVAPDLPSSSAFRNHDNVSLRPESSDVAPVPVQTSNTTIAITDLSRHQSIGFAHKFIPLKQRNQSVPCVIDTHRESTWNPMNSYIQNQPTDKGLLYVKIEKAASSTLASVAARTAHAVAIRSNANVTRTDGSKVPNICRFRGLTHLWSKRSPDFATRNREDTFLWTFFKDPAKRELSIYFFFMIDWKPGQRNYTETDVIDYLNETKIGQLQSIHPHRKKEYFEQIMDDDTLAKQFVQETMEQMDFLGLVERMDESLVLLSFMLDLPVTDVLYLDSKVAGSYMVHPNEKACRQIGRKRKLFPSTEQFLRSDRWKKVSKLEQMVYDAINRSIDVTIDDVVGRDVFNVRLQEFLRAKALAQDRCSNKVVMTCTADGNLTAVNERSVCYNGDVGCGHLCMDKLFPFE